MKKKIIFIIVGVILIGCIVGVLLLYQFTEIFGKKVIPVKVNSITLRYTPGYDVKTAESLNTDKEKFIEVQEIKLKGDDLQRIKRAVRKIKNYSSSTSEAIVDQYELIINNDVVVEVGEAKGIVVQGKKSTSVIIPSSTYQEIEKIVDDNNKKVLKTISTDTVTVKLEGASISIQNKDNLKYIKEYLFYYPVSIKEDYKKYDDGYKIEMILDQNVHLYLYNDKIGYLSQKDGETDTSTYVVFTNNMFDLIQKIYETSTK